MKKSRNDGNNKTYRITVRMTQAEYKSLIHKAEEHGCSKADYVRRAILAKPVLKVDTRNELMELRLQLQHLGNNLNQVAKNINGNYYHFPEEIKSVKDVIGQVNQALVLILKRLS